MIHKRYFKCERCGLCCSTSVVKLDRVDISRLEKLGKDNFYEHDSFINSLVLKRNKNGCIFLVYNDGNAFCDVYTSRPKVCKDYPFVQGDVVETCKPMTFANRFSK